MREQIRYVYSREGDVRAAQDARRQAQDEMPAHEWNAKREALIASGLVAERAKEHEDARA